MPFMPGPVFNCFTISITCAASFTIFQGIEVLQFNTVGSTTYALMTPRDEFSLNGIQMLRIKPILRVQYQQNTSIDGCA